MIGIIASPSEEAPVREFFELFKTPWEFYRVGCQYDAVLSTDAAQLDGITPRLLLVYSSQRTAVDREQEIQTHSPRPTPIVLYAEAQFPIYGNCVTFRHNGTSVLAEKGTGESVAYVDRSSERILVRVGYDLFREVETLLTRGQPPANAEIPTLDRHIAFLRDVITSCGVPLLEIPPMPDGYPFIACLTHDVDHPSIRRHRFDHTMFGFLYRATLGSAIRAGRGRLPFRKLLKNWGAAAKLPLMHLGLAKDIWYEFDRYVELERGKPSTFFFLPFQGTAGRTANGRAPRARAAAYDISHIKEKIPRLQSAGCEIGLHGIDAWTDSSRGREEANRIAEFSGRNELGVRMHWLYRNQDTPAKLEAAGFSYDSTAGYNEAVGYWAGTGQVFKPLGNTRTLELPMHVMDTALFNADRLGLSPGEAWERVSPILENAVRLGGALTLNWHDRSIAPERQWDDFYLDFLGEMEKRQPWFATASQAIGWFRKRRSAVFEKVELAGDGFRAKVALQGKADDLPGLRLRSHRSPGEFTEAVIQGSGDVHLRN